jgi:DHA2 family multidrug resistance protein
LYRVSQGVAGAVLAPLAQSVILDINPREKMGQGMAIFGMGIMIGPIIGPTLGGWLTENMGWRYVFFINVPVGALALAGVIFFLPNGSPRARRFDFFGFAMLALAIGALQLLLDRGQGLDWFHSAECWIYLGLVITGFWVFVLHSLDTPEPFISLQVFTDRNFVMGMLFIFIIGLTLFSSLALLPPLLQGLLGYPVMTAGLVMAPRGIGTLISMAVVGRVSGKVDARLLVTFGISLSAFSLWIMTGFDTVMNMRPIITSGIIQGFGLGFVFVPLTTLTFATLSPKLRGDATALFSLVRNVGSGIGISIVSTVLARMIGVNHAELASRVTADNPAIREVAPALLHHSPLYGAMISGLVSRQSAMIAYIDNFLLMIFFTLTALPIVFLLRQPKHHEAGPVMEAMGE